ncbi:ubiquitin carboxyl-terminal hydrolase 40 isoform 2-T2 [Fundulus diaphanus]
MFGNLFEEEDDEGFASTSTKGRAAKGGEEPPPPRGRSNLCGIKNQGGTCYLNSLLQTLLFTPEFREELFNLGPEELGCLEDRDEPGAKVRVIPLELQRLFSRLLLVDHQSASTTDLTDSFGWNSSEGTNQHDVQELNRILFSALEHSLVGTSGSTLIQRLYHGTIVNSIECKECGNVSQRKEDFLDLTVCVCGVSSLEEALWNMFVEEELFEGNNLYRCAQCSRLVTAAKSAKLKQLPPFMTMSLLRFSFDFAKCERYKETGRYSFPLTINLRPFCEQTDAEDSDFTYDLFSVIIHKGGCYGGHYHVYIKDIDELGLWEPLEEDCKPKTQKKIKEEVKESSEPNLQEDDPLSIITAIIAQESSKSVLLDQLGQKLMDKTGSSWSKRFRKHHGPIGKFLQSHNDVFILVSNGTRVALKANPPSPVTDASAPSEQTTSSEPSAAPDRAASDLQPKANQKPKPKPEGSHWFDLNDSTVTSIRESDIEKQFQGKESAYMLFYRKTQLHRPSEALNNPQYKVPSQLIQLAQDENRRLQQMREEFEAANNTLELHLHLAPFYKMVNGVLQPVGKDPAGSINLSFDRRKTVGDLRITIYQMQELWEGDMALSVAKSLPAGLHLYNTLTDDSVSLYSAGIHTNTDLFVWNGKEVCGAGVRTGAEWEPVLLTVVRPFIDEDVEQEAQNGVKSEKCSAGSENVGPGLKREARGFAGGATLGEVREALGEPRGSLLCQEHKRGEGGVLGAGEGGGASGWRVFPPDDMQRTLKELSLKDGDALLVLEPDSFDSSVFTRDGDMVTVTTPSDCRWLQVEFRPQIKGGEEEQEEQRKKVKVPATGNMLLCEVKQRAIEELQLQEETLGAAYCLRQVDCSGKLLPPVFEELSVRDAGVRLMTTLTLCPGNAPKESQLFLHFTVGSAPSAGMEMDIIVEKTCTVKECLKAMLDAVGLDGTSWHLRRLDWCEEVGEPLMDEDASLSEMKIGSGDTLVVTEGLLPPKGFLKLSVWLYVDLRPMETDCSRSETSPAEQQMQGAEATDGSCAQSISLCVGNAAELRNVGKVEISDDATLEDLKTQVLTLPALQDVCFPITSFLRVWQMEGGRLTRILRGQQLTLRKLKLTTGTDLCVQGLLKEEELGPKQVLLNIKMGVPGERSYYPPEELVWDASHDSSPRSLRTCLAAHYGLSPDSLLLAKHQPEKHAWEEISNWTHQVSKKKKKKKAESLLGPPFHLRDGDVIGIKNLLIDNNRDFVTADDQQGQQRLREQAEQRRKGWDFSFFHTSGNRDPTKFSISNFYYLCNMSVLNFKAVLVKYQIFASFSGSSLQHLTVLEKPNPGSWRCRYPSVLEYSDSIHLCC